MNQFELSGIVDSVESRETRRGMPFHVVTVRDEEDRSIPVAYFGTPPRCGEEVEFRGSLTGRNGYLNLEIETAKFGEGPIKIRRGAKVSKPQTVPFEDGDDALPF